METVICFLASKSANNIVYQYSSQSIAVSITKVKPMADGQ